MRNFIKNISLFFLLYIIIVCAAKIIEYKIGFKFPKNIYNTQSRINSNWCGYRKAMIGRIDSSKYLCHKTNRYGLQGNNWRTEEVELFFVGDSYTEMTYVDQSQTVDQMIFDKYGVKSFNVGLTGGGIPSLKFANYLINEHGFKPKYIFIQVIERGFGEYSKDLFQSSNPFMEILHSIFSVRLNLNSLSNFFKSKSDYEYNHKIIDGYKQYFQMYESPKIYGIKKILENMVIYQKQMAKKGIKVYYTIIPEPETAFRYITDIKQNNSLLEFEKLALETELNFISLYNEFCNEPMKYYFKDDSHWNENGIIMYMNKIEEIIR
tara:strand:+ start:1951 stop:2913 length:963 start_codon:yes stop_codon:yes gene_type:complete